MADESLALPITTTLQSITNILRVAKSNADYTTIQDAIDASSSGGTIEVYPGTYAEDITLNKNVRIYGDTVGSTVISGTVTWASGATKCLMTNFLFLGPTSGSGAIVDLSAMLSSHAFMLNRCLFVGRGAGKGIEMSGAGHLSMVDGVYHHGGTFTGPFIEVSAGILYAQEINLAYGSSTDALKVTGGKVIVQGMTFQPASYYTCTDGIEISGGELYLDSLLMDEVVSGATNALHISGDSIFLHMSSSKFHSTSGGYDILTDGGLTGASTELSIEGQFSLEKTDFPSGYEQNCAKFYLMFFDVAINNTPALRINNDVDIGTPSIPSKLAVGEGDAITDGMLVLGFDGSSFTDNTADAKSRGGSSFTVFPSLTAGVFYLGNTRRKFYGTTLFVAGAMVRGTAVITSEYWNGSSWTGFNYMCNKESNPYTQYGDDIFERDQNEELRFDSGAMEVDWVTNSVNGQTAYWVRFHISSGTMTTSPLLERVLCHTNSTEIKLNGFQSYFGQGEITKTLVPSARYPVSGFTPADATFNFSTNVALEIPNSLFAGNKLDGFGQTIIVPFGLDTSRPLTVDIKWTMADSNTGDVELTCILVTGGITGVNVDNSALTEETKTAVATISSDQTGILNDTTFTFDISGELPGNELIFEIQRNADAGNANDTNSGSVKIYSTEFTAIFWTG